MRGRKVRGAVYAVCAAAVVAAVVAAWRLPALRPSTTEDSRDLAGSLVEIAAAEWGRIETAAPAGDAVAVAAESGAVEAAAPGSAAPVEPVPEAPVREAIGSREAAREEIQRLLRSRPLSSGQLESLLDAMQRIGESRRELAALADAPENALHIADIQERMRRARSDIREILATERPSRIRLR